MPLRPPLLPLVLVLAPAGSEPPPFWQVVEAAVRRAGAQEQFAAVLEHMAGVPERRRVAHRLSLVDRGLVEPWTVPALAAELREGLARPGIERGRPLAEVVDAMLPWLDLAQAAPAGLAELEELWSRVDDEQLEGRELLEALSELTGLAHLLLDRSLGGLEPGHWPVLFEGFPAFAEAWYRNHFPGARLDEDQAAAIAAFRELLTAPRTDRRLTLGVARVLLRLSDQRFLADLKRRLRDVEAAEEAPDGLLAVVGDSPSRRVVLAGRGDDVHTTGAALLIDLAGDDEYRRAAVVDSTDSLVSIVLDLAGDDRHVSEGPGPAYSTGGVALLVDLEGDDRYVSGRLGQAATALGFAALVDLEGNDVYEAEDYAQGHATGGVALLHDLEGDDTYTAWAFAQAGGIGVGLSALVDGEGNDRYLADLHWPDVYGDSGPGVHHGASQGYCTGLRSDVAGGLAALVDLGEGEDSYRSGSFAQGGGYYFSFGLMYDGGGDDENEGSRYSQGFGVHQAIGVRHDAGGDDRYTCRSVAHAGMAWDEGVGFLLEDGGDDVYRVGALGCGGAAQTGVAICIDAGGRDEYVSGNASQGGCGGSEYHGKPSLGVLIDLGGDEDRYSAEGRGDDLLRATAGVEVFLDCDARDARRALRARELR